QPGSGPDWPDRVRSLVGPSTGPVGPDGTRAGDWPRIRAHAALRPDHAPGPVPGLRLGRHATDRAADEVVAKLGGHAGRGRPARPASGRIRWCQFAAEPAAATAVAPADVQWGDARAVRPRRRRGVLSRWRLARQAGRSAC